MTQDNPQSRLNSGPTAPDLGPSSDTLAEILAELRDITQQVDGSDRSYAPLEPTSATSMRRGIRFTEPPSKKRWPVTVAVGGGALVLAGVLALPLSGTLFPGKAEKSLAGLSPSTNESAASGKDRIAGIDAKENPGTLSKQEMESLLRQERSVSAPTAALQYAVNVGEQVSPTSTASIAPQAAKKEPSITLPVVEMPEPLAVKDLALTPQASPGTSTARSEVGAGRTAESVPGSGPASGTRVASLGDVAIAPVTPALSAAQAAGLLTRAQELVQNRDISSARLILEKALSGGSPEAAFQLAETYDPQMLSAWSVRGINGDAKRAKELYAKASQGGVTAARERLNGLQEEASR
jgi:hypothetical protein